MINFRLFKWHTNTLINKWTVITQLFTRFGQSLGGSLVPGNIAVPHPKVIEVGSFLSTFGAGLQSLTGAPRLLQSIAKDETIPFLKPMAVLSKSNEPTRALFVTLSICQLAVLIGNVDAVAPLLRY